MAPEKFTAEHFYATLEELGEAKVRERLATGAWGKLGPKVELANVWVDEKDRARASASESEQIEIARSAKEAAWVAAEAARESAIEASEASRFAKAANIRTTIMLIITAISVIATIVIFYLRPS